MKKTLLILLLIWGLSSNAQKINFEYDVVGNQILRTYCPNCNSRIPQENLKETSELTTEDLQKFFPEDVISYYPNPVKEELFLKWELINDNKVLDINVYNPSGQLVDAYGNLEKVDSKSFSFVDYPVGLYLIVLNYSNGEQKSITIIKK